MTSEDKKSKFIRIFIPVRDFEIRSEIQFFHSFIYIIIICYLILIKFNMKI